MTRKNEMPEIETFNELLLPSKGPLTLSWVSPNIFTYWVLEEEGDDLWEEIEYMECPGK
jgi:hypothetical protein